MRNHLQHRYLAPSFVVALALALLWPALINGGPFWFPDTTNYIRGADAAVAALTGYESEWSDRLAHVDPNPGRASQSNLAGKADLVPTRPVISGRSIYYGFLLYIPIHLLGTWGAAALQALIVAGLFTLCLGLASRLVGADPKRLVPLCSLVLLGSPLPYFTSMLMPDVYSGLIILVLVTAICLWDGLTRSARVILVGMSAILATFHTTHVLIALAIGVCSALAMAPRQRARPLFIVAVPVLSALAAGSLFSLGVKAQLGEAPLSPPLSLGAPDGVGTRHYVLARAVRWRCRPLRPLQLSGPASARQRQLSLEHQPNAWTFPGGRPDRSAAHRTAGQAVPAGSLAIRSNRLCGLVRFVRDRDADDLRLARVQLHRRKASGDFAEASGSAGCTNGQVARVSERNANRDRGRNGDRDDRCVPPGHCISPTETRSLGRR